MSLIRCSQGEKERVGRWWGYGVMRDSASLGLESHKHQLLWRSTFQEPSSHDDAKLPAFSVAPVMCHLRSDLWEGQGLGLQAGLPLTHKGGDFYPKPKSSTAQDTSPAKSVCHYGKNPDCIPLTGNSKRGGERTVKHGVFCSCDLPSRMRLRPVSLGRSISRGTEGWQRVSSCSAMLALFHRLMSFGAFSEGLKRQPCKP